MELMDMFGYFVIGVLLFICLYFYLDNMHSFELKCVVSSVNGNKYCVRERKKLKNAADLLASTAGQLKRKEIFVKQAIEPAVASFGKGFSISPLKLAQLHAALANGGYEVTPHVTLNFKDPSVKNSRKQFFTSEVSQIVLEWMESVVENGSGAGAKIEGYRIAGKTGTSQKAKNGVYTSKKVCSFVATLPVNNPKYIVVVVIDEPSKSYAYGATVAVPVAKEIIESLIVIEKIPPSNTDMIVKKP